MLKYKIFIFIKIKPKITLPKYFFSLKQIIILISMLANKELRVNYIE